MRLDKALSTFTTYSRTELKKLIARGSITVNGSPAVRPDQRVEPGRDRVALCGEEIVCGPIYIMLNKPQGVVSSTEDKRDTTVLDMVPPGLRRKNLFPAGRLDKDTVGFVLLTDDGDFAHRILSPKKHVPKVYSVRVEGSVDEETVRRFRQGVVLGDGTICAPAELEILSSGRQCEARVVLHEGMYHQIKRMFAACGGEVVFLKREKIGGLALDEALEPGKCRALTPEEVRQIQENPAPGEKRT